MSSCRRSPEMRSVAGGSFIRCQNTDSRYILNRDARELCLCPKNAQRPSANLYTIRTMFGDNERKQKEQEMLREGRLPPGQSLTLKWPVLHYGSVPRFDPAQWDFRVWGLVEHPLQLTWDEFNKLPRTKDTSDFHCVTRWSRFDNQW